MRGGDARGVLHVPLRFPWLLVIAVAVRIGIVLAGRQVGYPAGGLLNVVYVVGLLAWVLVNIRVRGFPLVAIGVAANLAVLLTNDGHMPVLLDMTRPDDYQLAARYFAAGNDVVHGVMQCSRGVPLPSCPGKPLWFLADIIRIPLGGIGRELASAGDVLIAAGVGMTAYSYSRGSVALTSATDASSPIRLPRK